MKGRPAARGATGPIPFLNRQETKRPQQRWCFLTILFFLLLAAVFVLSYLSKGPAASDRTRFDSSPHSPSSSFLGAASKEGEKGLLPSIAREAGIDSTMKKNQAAAGGGGLGSGFPTARRLSAAVSHMPALVYGTAWKKERSADLVYEALKSGFRGVDTACQPRHYNEPSVGEGIHRAISDGILKRSELFLQTKFSPPSAQDTKTVPYDLASPIEAQVEKSLQVSLKNLRTDYLDSWVLHSPYPKYADTLRAYRAMEQFVGTGVVKALGISNLYDESQLASLYRDAVVKPSVVQNRFYGDTKYDQGIRQFCLEHDIAYQSFWSLTANPKTIGSSAVGRIAKERALTNEQVFFRFLMDMGITPLTGTTNKLHMDQDLAVLQQPPLHSHEVEDIWSYLLKS